MSSLEDSPIPCSLTIAELRDREAALLTRFKTAVIETEELDEGYAFRLPGHATLIELVAELIVAERDCCPFLTFEVTALPNLGPVIVRVTGPAGAREFVRTILCKREESA